MTPLTEEQYYEIFRKASVILNRGQASSKTPIRSSNFLVLDLQGLKRLRDEYTTKGRDALGRFNGKLEAIRAMIKEDLNAWKAYRDAQPNLPKDAKPVGIWLDKLNRHKALLRVSEEECRFLSRLIDRETKREAALEAKRKQSPAYKRRSALSGKMKDGKLVKFGGREVVQDEEGNDIFKDDGSPVADYIEKVRRQRKAEKKKRAQK